MKAEKYIFNYIRDHKISIELIKKDTGIDMERICKGDSNLLADDFLRLCMYLGITPEEVSDQVL